MQRVEKSIIVNVPSDEAYRFWLNFEAFPHFMHNIKDVRRTGEGSFHWVAGGLLGRSIEWDAELTENQPNRAIGWNSTGGDIETTGEVTFQPMDQGTKVTVVMNYYDVPGGALGEVVARLLQEPDQRLERDLRTFKQMLESEVLGRHP